MPFLLFSYKRNLRKNVLHCFLLSTLAFLLHPPTANAGTGTFSPTSPMTTGRYSYAVTLLANGQVLLAGGWNYSLNVYLASAELYDPATGIFTATGSMTTPRANATATLLSSGEVLIAGGSNCEGCVLASAELYNPASGTFSATGPMTTPRYDHTSTLLFNGKVLLAGGCSGAGTCPLQASAEIYNPKTGAFSATGPMTTARYAHHATLLSNGEVLIAGGADNNGNQNALASAELYDPATGGFTTTGSMITGRYSQGTAALLLNGKVLFPGGCGNSGPLASAELYNPATGIFSATGSMAAARCYHTAALMLTGEVLIAGGASNASAELYEPTKGTFIATGSMNTAGIDFVTPAATLLPNGEVLIAGGGVSSGPPLTNAELYQDYSPLWRAAFGMFWQFGK